MLQKNDILAAIDIGNSRIKILIDDDFYALDYNERWEDNLFHVLNSFSRNKIILGYSSVNTEHEQSFLNLIKELKNVELTDIQPFLLSSKIIKYDKIQGIGKDRIMGMIGALSMTEPPLITVDCGTAVTINAVDKKHECIGGAIFAGAATQLKALADSTSGLKKVELSKKVKKIGKTTSDAMTSGIVLSVTGGIKESIESICHNYFGNQPVPVFITGGFAETVIKQLKDSSIHLVHSMHLINDGILYLLKKSLD